MEGQKQSVLKSFFSLLKGDRSIWAAATLLALFSFIPIYSSSSNLVYVLGKGDTFQHLVAHFMHLFFGFIIIYAMHRIPYQYFRGLSILAIPVIVVLLIITWNQGTTIQGVSASRWIKIPIIGKSFQTSELASLILMIYVARYLSKIKDKAITFQESLLPLWLPVMLIVGLILPANLSTAAILMAMVLLLTFIGGYPIKYLLYVTAILAVAGGLFYVTAKAFPQVMPDRMVTWQKRVENFRNPTHEKADTYQIDRSKMAIARGGVIGVGVGKSVQRNFLPQSTSDFIFAIIVEEMGLMGGFGVMILYLWLFYRIILVAVKSESAFGKLLTIGIGLPIVFQAFINMAVTVQLFPVTGQTLPLISDGGSSIWMTCAALGIILGVSVKREEDEKKELEKTENQNPLEILSETL